MPDAPRDDSVTISFDGHQTAGIYSIDHGQPEMTLIALIGDDDCLEIRLVGESANAFLSVGVGAGGFGADKGAPGKGRAQITLKRPRGIVAVGELQRGLVVVQPA